MKCVVFQATVEHTDGTELVEQELDLVFGWFMEFLSKLENVGYPSGQMFKNDRVWSPKR